MAEHYRLPIAQVLDDTAGHFWQAYDRMVKTRNETIELVEKVGPMAFMFGL